MNTTALRKTSRADLSARYRAYLRNAKLGAVALVSLSTLRALSAVEQRQAERLTRSIVAQGQTDDSTLDPETESALADREETPTHAARSFMLAPSERSALNAARPGSRSVIWRKPAAPAIDDGDQPLPADFTPAPFVPYESAFLPPSAELAAIEAEAAEEAALEVAHRERTDALSAAAVAFRSDWDAAPIADYAPAALEVAPVAHSPIAPRAEVKAALRDAVSEHAALLAAVLGNARTARRSTMAAR